MAASIAAAARATQAWLRHLAATVRQLARSLRNRRALAPLAEWDERALRDIGLTRADLHLALGAPLSEDPSTQLARWAQERRSARLLQRREAREWATQAEPPGAGRPPARIASIACR